MVIADTGVCHYLLHDVVFAEEAARVSMVRWGRGWITVVVFDTLPHAPQGFIPHAVNHPHAHSSSTAHTYPMIPLQSCWAQDHRGCLYLGSMQLCQFLFLQHLHSVGKLLWHKLAGLCFNRQTTVWRETGLNSSSSLNWARFFVGIACADLLHAIGLKNHKRTNMIVSLGLLSQRKSFNY